MPQTVLQALERLASALGRLQIELSRSCIVIIHTHYQIAEVKELFDEMVDEAPTLTRNPRAPTKD